jgi:hypothetical protein
VAAVIVAAALTTTAGAWLLAGRLLTDSTPARNAELSGVAVSLEGAGWVPMESHHMDQQGGYQMPAQMMPGAPEGDDMRLGIPLTLTNTSPQTRQFNLLEEFSLVGGATASPVRLHSDTFGLLSRLGPGTAVSGVLYFDTTVPGPAEPPLLLRWHRGGESIDLVVSMSGASPASHPSHGS